MIYNQQKGWQLVGRSDDVNIQQHQQQNNNNNNNQNDVALVNIGDFLSDMTSGILHSSLHCVANINDLLIDDNNNNNNNNNNN
eukprot:UN10439